MAWYDTPSIPVGRGEFLTPFWHCYGANACEIDAATIVQMVMLGKANLFPINTHRPERGLIIGDGFAPWKAMKSYHVINQLVPCLNINLCTTPEDAVSATWAAFNQTGIDLLKLEVLQDGMKVADDAGVLSAAEELCAAGFRVMPLITADLAAAKALHEMGCPLVRVQGSPIGSGRGIENPEAVSAIVNAGVRVILDCGIGTAAHILEAFRLGCKGFLVDYLLFKDGDPAQAIRNLRSALDAAAPRRAHPDLVGESDWTKEWEGALT